jgi:hypothetical protein
MKDHEDATDTRHDSRGAAQPGDEADEASDVQVGLQRVGQAIGDADAILDQVASGFDQLPERAHVCSLAAQWLELVAMAQKQIQVSLGGPGCD